MRDRSFRFALGIVLVLAGGCRSSPSGDVQREPSFALPADSEAPLARVLAREGRSSPSSFAAIDRGSDAFDLRLALTDEAEHAIDAQYYIWHGDRSGRLLLHRLLLAADRGVRVRLLVDDFAFAGSDRDTAAISTHPNLEIRIFNPVGRRLTRFGEALSFVVNLDRLNHRMHNKLFIADNAAVIMGGRNIGDEYFGASGEFNFRDLDVLATGEVVTELSDSFDLFWNSEWSVPVAALTRRKVGPDVVEKLRGKLVDQLKKDDGLPTGMDPTDWTERLGGLELLPGVAQVLQDDPDVALAESVTRIMTELESVEEFAHSELLIVSAYFVPEDEWVAKVKRHVDRGVRVRILTNSLESLDSTITNSVYKGYRKRLIQAGAELYELRGDARDGEHIARDPESRARTGLHAKAAVFDDSVCFIGSMNLDPRSLVLNTEIALVIESPELCAVVKAALERDLEPTNSWRVVEDGVGGLRWDSSDGSVWRQPAASAWQRIVDFFYTLLPAKSQI